MNRRISVYLITAMASFGAFLLFTMEPLVGRLLTPYFGGVSHVWLTCLMFFQGMLFLGYLYAHWVEPKVGAWHLLLLAVPFVVLPLNITARVEEGPPLVAILVVLISRVALPFMVLSTTAVVAQSWFARSSLGKTGEPYPLYAASNAGSLFALLGYVFVIEPLLGVRAQRLAWSGAYVIYIAIVGLTWLALRPRMMKRAAHAGGGSRLKPPGPSYSRYGKWFLLSGMPSAFLLAVTNFIALEVGSFPFVWVLPLALYLGSFIVAFRTNGGVPHFLRLFWLETLVVAAGLYVLGSAHVWVLLGHLLTFFLICLVSHGLLYESRPEPVRLTHFYLASALGGWLGGAFTALVVPHAFSGLYEYPLLVALFAFVFWRNRHAAFSEFWPRVSRLAAWGRMLVLGALVFPIGVGLKHYGTEATQFRHRNFYGTYRIVDKPKKDTAPAIRILQHGATQHGAQLLASHMRHTPVSYYYETGPIADAYRLVPSPRRTAVVGLGSGTISAYMNRGDRLTYYEIDPDNERIARDWFTYLDESRGVIDIVVGDGRLSLQNSTTRTLRYDLITVDAFTGDGIPTHLLTAEAMRIYFDHLAENGLLLLHISNRYYDLRPVIKATAATMGLYGAVKSRPSRNTLRSYEQASVCTILSRDPGRLTPLFDKGWISFGGGDGLQDVAPWTDDYINMLAPLYINMSAQIGALLKK